MRRKRMYAKITKYNRDKTIRYDLKAMDYGEVDRYILKKYVKLKNGKWSGSMGSKIIMDTVDDFEIYEMLTIMKEHIQEARNLIPDEIKENVVNEILNDKNCLDELEEL